MTETVDPIRIILMLIFFFLFINNEVGGGLYKDLSCPSILKTFVILPLLWYAGFGTWGLGTSE